MALPTLQDAKDYLRVDTTDEDALLTAFLARAKSSIEVMLGYSMAAVQVTWVDYARDFVSRYLQLPGPFALSPAPVVTDVDSVVIDATTYTLDQRSGKIRAKLNDWLFASSQYTVVATIGLSAHPDYAIRLESIAGTAILDLVAHYYQNRNPAIQSEGGGGASLSSSAIPERIQGNLLAFPCLSLVA